jgi:hypothetical protein
MECASTPSCATPLCCFTAPRSALTRRRKGDGALGGRGSPRSTSSPGAAIPAVCRGASRDGETRTRTGDTTIFRESARRVRAHEGPANAAISAVNPRRDPVTFGRFGECLGLCRGLEVPVSRGRTAATGTGRSAVCATLGSQTGAMLHGGRQLSPHTRANAGWRRLGPRILRRTPRRRPGLRPT